MPVAYPSRTRRIVPAHMMPLIAPELDPAFDIRTPDAEAGAVLFNSPHSGRVYPAGFLAASRLDLQHLRRSEDCFVDALLEPVVAAGFALMRAHFPRAYVDVNREPYELDPRMFEGRLPAYANTRSMRVAGGLGTVARVVGDGQEIYAGRIPVDEAMARIEGCYKPYHRALRHQITGLQHRFGAAVLVDCHSMPSTPSSRGDGLRADIVIGDRYGTSCSPLVSDLVERHLSARGYRVGRNKPYAGGFIAEHYGNPSAGLHAIQIEVCRSLYLNERAYEPNAGFARVSADLSGLGAALAAIPLVQLEACRSAAE
jgi:N-formylglutamate deformylase